MSELNKSFRQTGEVDIRVLKTMQPYCYFKKANVTTPNIEGSSSYAMANGAKAHSYANPIDGGIKIEAQTIPFSMLSLFSDGEVQEKGIEPVKETIVASVASELTLPEGVVAGTVYVYKEGEYGQIPIEGTFSGTKFTATLPADISMSSSYEVCYLVSKESGIKVISFDDEHLPKDYFITIKTASKSDDGTITATKMIGYKCAPVRSFEVTLSSEGDPSNFVFQFDLLKDKNGKVFDVMEIA